MAVSNIEILNKVTTIAESTARLEVKVDDLVKIVKGNGQPGLMQRMGTLESCVAKHHEDDAKEKEGEAYKKKSRMDFSSKVWLAVIAMIVSNIGIIVFGLLK